MTTPKHVKTCPRYGLEKPLADFGSDRRNPDGRDTYCRECRHAIWRKPRGGVTHLLAKFTDAELLAELTRRNLIATKLDELGALVAPEYEADEPTDEEETAE